MKHNMDRVREILFRVEADEGGKIALNHPLDAYSADVIGRRVERMVDRGLLEGTVVSGGGGPGHNVLAFDIRRMTWEGHDFLDGARNDTIGIKAKRLCREKTGGLTFDLSKTCLLETARGAITACVRGPIGEDAGKHL